MQFIISALLLAVPSTTTLPAQRAQSQPVAKKPKKDEAQLQVFALRYAEAKQAMNTLMPFLDGDVRLSIDARTNSVIAYGAPDDMAKLEVLLEQIDGPAEQDKDKSSYVVIRVRSDVNAIVTNLRSLVGNVRIISDSVTKSLIVSGTPDQIQQIKSLVEVLDVPKPKPTAKQYKLRVVWLLSGETGKPLPKDLLPVVGALEKIGITDLKLVTQSLVNISDPGSNFDVSGTMDENGQSLRLSGERSERESGRIKLELAVEAQPKELRQPVAVEASISLTPGQTAVLGVTQTGKGNSAFIVQLVEGL